MTVGPGPPGIAAGKTGGAPLGSQRFGRPQIANPIAAGKTGGAPLGSQRFGRPQIANPIAAGKTGGAPLGSQRFGRPQIANPIAAGKTGGAPLGPNGRPAAPPLAIWARPALAQAGGRRPDCPESRTRRPAAAGASSRPGPPSRTGRRS